MNPAPSSVPLPAEGERRVDPSMEEILASIRKIIADDESPILRGPLRPAEDTFRPPLPPRGEEMRPAGVVTPIMPVAANASRQAAPIFGLSRPPAPAGVPPFAPRPGEAMASEPVEHGVSGGHRGASGEPGAPGGHERPPVQVAATSSPAPQPAEIAPRDAVTLVSAETKTSVSSAFQALTASVALTAGDAIDRHVREMLRPMLRTWLDDNLPVIVEKLVRIEIERVARGGR